MLQFSLLLTLKVIIKEKCPHTLGFPGGASDKEPSFQCRRHKRHGFDPSVMKILCRRCSCLFLFCSCLENRRISWAKGVWQGTGHRITKNWTQLKQLSTQIPTCFHNMYYYIGFFFFLVPFYTIANYFFFFIGTFLKIEKNLKKIAYIYAIHTHTHTHTHTHIYT